MGVTHHGRTRRLDLADPTLREWECTVLHADPEQGVVLDRSAFYPGGGGQPPDHGVLLWQGVQTRIVGTRKGDDLWLIPADGGTHVASTAQIGKVQVVKVESKGRANRRVRVRLAD
ncbi:alanine--tRNA ligase-related protein [Micromonospora echinofusca]|uniref:alanine--tRNA ligase-related protein n=1 Tax=Micromonospora echinofusca TaxID=47858 RepID=UPI00344A1632